ncbi:MAG: hypothetical protein GY705_23500 [Bacteroidetes bacterium]|nr:hypothetical protein [Bacteroidota bacterium]
MNRFTKRLQFNAEQLNEIYPLLIKIDAIKAQWEISDKLSPKLIERLQHSVIVTSSGASTRIEGSKLSDEEVANLFKEMRIQKFKTRDEQEVAGYIELLKNVFDHWNDIDLSENTILSFHKQLMKFSEKDQSHKGQYKTGSNRGQYISNCHRRGGGFYLYFRSK